MSAFYIVSTKWTRKTDRYVTFWRPDANGYAWPLSWSGKYSHEQIQTQPDYYIDGANTFAVPCEIVDAMAVAPAPGTVDNDAGPVVLNTHDNRQDLVAACPFATVKPIAWPWFARQQAWGRMNTIYNCAGCGRFVSDAQRFAGNCANCGTDNRP